MGNGQAPYDGKKLCQEFITRGVTCWTFWRPRSDDRRGRIAAAVRELASGARRSGIRAYQRLPCGMSECGIDRRHHLLGHQLHRVARELRVRPVVAAIEQRAEVADRLAEREDLV